MEYFKSRNGLLPSNPKNKKNFIKTYNDVVSSRNDAMVVLKTGDRAALNKLKRLPKNLNLNKDEELFKLLKDNAAKELILEEERKRGFKPILQREDINNMLTLLENPRESINPKLMETLTEVIKQANNRFNEIENTAKNAKEIADKVDNLITKAPSVPRTKPPLSPEVKEKRKNQLAYIKSKDKEFKYTDVKKVDEEYNRIKELEKLEEYNRIKELEKLPMTIEEPDESIEGSGLFSSISSMIGKYAPSIVKQTKIIAPSLLEAGKKVIKNPKNQKAAFDFVKEKLKKKEPEKPKELTEREQLFQMFKNKEITADEYKNLKSDLPIQEVKPIQEVNPVIEDANIKNLSNEIDPKKIYLDLLSKKQITPEQYLNIISGGKKLNLSKPIDKDNFIEETALQGKGYKKIKRKYKT